MEHASEPRFRFGVFEAYPAAGELRKHGRRVRLQEQPFRVLMLLLEHAGAVVSREELQRTLWPTNTFVEFDQGLNTAIKKLRTALGDSADNPRFIETLPRKGYRFIAPVSTGEAAAAPLPPAPAKHGSRQLVVGIVLAALLIGVALWPGWKRATAPPPTPPLPVPLTTYPGVETHPSFSPDGRAVAFSWNGEREDNYDIYVKEIGSETARRLTTDPARDVGPAWSPDGSLIAFERILNEERATVMFTRAAGGPEVKVTEVDVQLVWQPFPYLAWSPDGKHLVVSDFDVPMGLSLRGKVRTTTGLRPGSLFLVSLETGRRQRLTSQADRLLLDSGPAFSPDGSKLAFVRRLTVGPSELYLLPLSRDCTPLGSPKQLTSRDQLSASPTWSSDGAEVVFAGGPHNWLRLWRIPADGSGPARLLEFAGDNVTCPAISRQGKLAYAKEAGGPDIWSVALSAPGVAAGPAKPFLASTRDEGNPQFSPDGKRVVFASNRSGFNEVWTANADGTNPMQLTSMQAHISGGANWSPDGSRVVFDSLKDGQFEVYVISAAGGAPHRLTDNPAVDGVPSWSRNGDWIYFGSTRTGGRQVWKMPAQGGPAIQVTRKGGYIAVESPDGRFLYYSKTGQFTRTVWKMPVGGGEESIVLRSVTFYNFAVTHDGIYFIPSADDGHYAVHFFSFATGQQSPVLPLSGELGYGMAVSPDGKTLLFTQIGHRGSDLMLFSELR